MKNFLYILLVLLLCSCHGDHIELSGDYLYASRYIAKVNPKNGVLDILIYDQVLNFTDDEDYIIAYQRPDRGMFEEFTKSLPKKEIDSLEHLYDKMQTIHHCYWIICKKGKQVFGPMTKKEFDMKCHSIGVKIKLNPRNENRYI